MKGSAPWTTDVYVEIHMRILALMLRTAFRELLDTMTLAASLSPW
jgi:hypothetical protein